MTPREVRWLVHELIDENPLAIRAVLKIVAIEFTERVPTLAVTMEARPRLLISMAFVREHCRRPEHVKAALCHEFLHVLLRHTSMRGPLTPARHLALDAVINAIIHRQLGTAYSSLMSRYYEHAQGPQMLLRPMTDVEQRRELDDPRRRLLPAAFVRMWSGLYAGRLVADDIEQLAADLPGLGPPGAPGRGIDRLLGNHADDVALPEALEQALDRARSEMNGGGIWRGASGGANPYAVLVNPRDAQLGAWRARTLAILRRHLAPAAGSPRTHAPVEARLPVLSPSDRRAFLRATWSPFLPEAVWPATAPRPEGRAQVYLDVSGSMNAEMPLIVALLGRLSPWIRRPFWAFSTRVAPALIERGVLKAETTGGTSLACVLEHIARTRPPAAVIVTDGYVEKIDPRQLAAVGNTRVHALVTRDGNPAPLRAAGIAYSQLGRLPK